MLYIFADCELDTDQHTLKRAGQAVHLRLQVYKVLLHLLENRDRVFSTDKLIEELWPDPYTSNGTVESTIKGVRQAVGDDGKAQRIIQTLHRQGYRFVAHLQGAFETIDSEGPEDLEEPEGWQCRFCQHINRVTATQKTRFCTQCGLAFAVSCPQCGVENSPRDNYCGTCGCALVSPPDSEPNTRGSGLLKLEPERRHLTVMSCDLVEAVSLLELVDLEDYRDIIRLYRETCDDVIRHYEGHIANDTGTGLLVYFGHPLAHADDPQRAVRTSLAITEALEALNARLSREKNVTLAVRWGIHTGSVVVEELTSGTQSGMVALGEVPNVALQIQRLAKPNTVVIGAATARLVEEYFVCQELGSHKLEESAQPIRLFRVLETRAQSPKGQTPFVGREVEIALLLDRWAQAKDGYGQVVLLSGEPGIGKSRLVRVLKDRFSNESYTLLECRCSPYHQQSALYPIIDLFRRRLYWEHDDSPEEKLEKLKMFCTQHALPHNDTIPCLAALLSLPAPEDYYPALRLTSQQQRQKTLEVLLSVALALIAEQPMLLIAEDLHWIDPSTLEFLGLLVEQVPTQSICAVFTYQPIFQAPWGVRSYMTHMPLARLSRVYVEQMVSHVTGGKALPVEVLLQIVDKTDGVPLFVEEFTKALIEAESLQEVGNQYELIAPLQATTIPATLHDSLMARLDRLDIAKRVAQLGAVLGRQFAYTLLQAVWEQEETRLQRGLGKLVEAELLYQRGRPPQATYMFKHALIQETAYQSLLKSTRQKFHRLAAHVLNNKFAEIVIMQPELLAYHYTEAGLIEQAIPSWEQAGALAVKRSANAEAVSHFTKGLELLQSLPVTSTHTQQELALQLSLGPPLRMIKGHMAPEVEQVYTRAYMLSKQVGNTSQQFSAMVGLGRLYLNCAKLLKAYKLGEQYLVLAQKSQDPLLLQDAHRMLGLSLFFRGEPALALLHIQQGSALYDAQQGYSRAFASGIDAGVVCLCLSAWSLWMLGYPDKALSQSLGALKLAQELSHPYSLVFASQYTALLHQSRREAQLAQQQADATIALAHEYGFVLWLAGGMCVRGWALAKQGVIEEGVEQLCEGIRTWKQLGVELGQTNFLCRLAELYIQEKQFGRTLGVLDTAFAAMQASDERHCETEVYRLQGELLLAQEATGQKVDEAEKSFRHALDLARRRQAKSLELRVAISLGRLWQQQDRREEAHQVLQESYSWFTEGLNTLDLQEAKTLLEAVT